MAEASLVGRIIDGKYQLLRPLGEGGMGVVYEAQSHIGGHVAIKLLHKAELAQDGRLVARFLREARASASIESQHIVRVFDTGVDSFAGVPYIVMELLRGEDLENVLARLGALNPTGACRVASQAAQGLAKAHAAGIVHRDIKPANLFLSVIEGSDEARVKILDFGIAKQEAPDRQALTQTGSVLGTPLYMSPEQAQGMKDLDSRADVWSLAMVLYTALAGRAPFADLDTVGKLIVAIVSRDVAPLQSLAPWIPTELAEVVQRALRRDVRDRTPSVLAFAEELRPFCGGSLAITPNVVVGVQDALKMTAVLSSDTARSSPGATFAVTAAEVDTARRDRYRRSPALRIAMALVGVAAVGVGSWFAWSRLSERNTPRPNPSSEVAQSASTGTSESAVATATSASSTATVKTAKLKVTLPAGGILKVGPQDWTARIGSDSTVELSGAPNTTFHIAIYVGKRQLVAQTHVLYDDGVVDPPDIGPEGPTLPSTLASAKGTGKPLGTATTTPSKTTDPVSTGKKGPLIDKAPE